MSRMTTKAVRMAAGAALVAGAMAVNAAQAQDLKRQTFSAVGTWGNLNNFKKHEGPFWRDVVPKASGGKSRPRFNRSPRSA